MKIERAGKKFGALTEMRYAVLPMGRYYQFAPSIRLSTRVCTGGRTTRRLTSFRQLDSRR